MLARSWPLLATLLLTAGAVSAQPPAAPDPGLPKVVLIGDSIRQGYAPFVAKRLEGKAIVFNPEKNGGDSNSVRAHVDEWMIDQKPAVIHFNAGLHDLRFTKETGRHQVEVDAYAVALRQIVDRLRKETTAGVVFANITPVIDERYNRKPDQMVTRHQADVLKYNAASEQVMRESGVPVNDLHWVVEQGGTAELLGGDGVHFTRVGYERLAEAVADSILRQLAIVQFPGTLPQPGTPEDTKRYQQAEAERDALVPEAFKKLPVPAFPVPVSTAEWSTRRPEVLKIVRDSLGDQPPRPDPKMARLVTRELRPGYILERVTIPNGIDGEVTAIVLVPEKRKSPAPAVLWLHSSTPDKNGVLAPNQNGGAEPLGEVLVKKGYIVMAPDACWYGDRSQQAPTSRDEYYRRGDGTSFRTAQDVLHKYHTLFGRTLWGMFVRDDQIALDYLANRPEVDKTRIGATGISMGSTRTWWLAAVDERIAAAAGVACMTRYQNLIAHGELRSHGVYYFGQGLLKHFDTEGVFALVAPRPLLMLTGDLDRGSPVDGVRDLEREVTRVYDAIGAKERFRNVIYPDTGHVYTEQMRAEVLGWFDRWLTPEK
jgi:lysophospholipase L1-like esterase/dienelactone hydrolase